MRIFRYRPLNPLLFKELRYREVYLASPAELNDPLDLNAQIDFAPRSENDWDALCQFLLKQAIGVHAGVHGRMELISVLCRLMVQDCLGRFLKDTLSLERGQCLTKEILFEAIAHFYQKHATEFPTFSKVDADDLYDAVNSICTNVLGNSAVACFSEVNDDFLMWSHYAGAHSGVCLEFEVEQTSDSICKFPIETIFPINGKPLIWTEDLQQVKYRSKLSMLPFYEYGRVFAEYGDVDLVHLSKSCWHAYARGIADLFLEKLVPWGSEREWRIVNVQFKETVSEERIRNYDGKALSAVFFGAKISEPNKQRVREALRWSGKPRFYQAIIDDSHKVKFRPDDE